MIVYSCCLIGHTYRCPAYGAAPRPAPRDAGMTLAGGRAAKACQRYKVCDNHNLHDTPEPRLCCHASVSPIGVQLLHVTV